jgi:hypothetical protein
VGPTQETQGTYEKSNEMETKTSLLTNNNYYIREKSSKSSKSFSTKY